ncbi:MAG: hypothetical protein O9257_06355 [Brevundimonas sp.]|jgi:hypothetical protein|nr:hypothetical protein [Brevundimonas sp.]
MVDQLNITISDWAIVAATLTSPIIAVIVTRLMDDRRSKRDRRWAIFETLMLTRRTPLSLDHVMALNRVEIEFADNQKR